MSDNYIYICPKCELKYSYVVHRCRTCGATLNIQVEDTWDEDDWDEFTERYQESLIED